MNNYTLYFAESNTRAAAQQMHGHWENKTPSKGFSTLTQHECRHRKYCEDGHHMPGVPANATKRKNVTLQNSKQTMKGGQW